MKVKQNKNYIVQQKIKKIKQIYLAKRIILNIRAIESVKKDIFFILFIIRKKILSLELLWNANLNGQLVGLF